MTENLGTREGFWTRNGREGWSRENILRRASHIQDVRQNTESGMSLDELSQNPVLDDTIRSYYNNPVQVAAGYVLIMYFRVMGDIEHLQLNRLIHISRF